MAGAWNFIAEVLSGICEADSGGHKGNPRDALEALEEIGARSTTQFRDLAKDVEELDPILDLQTLFHYLTMRWRGESSATA